MNIFHIAEINFLKLTHFKMRQTATNCLVVFKVFNTISCELPLELEHARLMNIMIFSPLLNVFECVILMRICWITCGRNKCD